MLNAGSLHTHLIPLVALIVVGVSWTEVTDVKDSGRIYAGLPPWKQAFASYKKWSGWYMYQQKQYWCRLYIHHVQQQEGEPVTATFTERNITMEILGKSPDNITVTFIKTLVYEENGMFPHDADFKMTGQVYPRHTDMWIYAGTITESSQNGSFQTFELLPESTGSPTNTSAVPSDESWRHGLAIGLPVVMAVICLTGTIAIIFWAFRKGYLRHVPLSYRRFTGRSPVSFNNTSSGTVHM